METKKTYFYLLVEKHTRHKKFKIGYTQQKYFCHRFYSIQKENGKLYKQIDLFEGEYTKCQALLIESLIRYEFEKNGYKLTGNDHFETTHTKIDEFTDVQDIFNYLKTYAPQQITM